MQHNAAFSKQVQVFYVDNMGNYAIFADPEV